MMLLNIFEKISKLSLPRITATEIVCGDCAGDDRLPIRTKLTSDGLCAGCGGRNYEFASIIGAALAQHLRSTKENEENYEYGKQKTDGESENDTRHFARKFRIVGR